MTTQVSKIVLLVDAIPSVNYGKFAWTYKPACDKSKKLLEALKRQFNYKASERNGKEIAERTTFAAEWIEYAQDHLQCDFKVDCVANIPQLLKGSLVSSKSTPINVTSDFSFLSK